MALNEFELRVLGAMVEKQIATPDYYPMTVNALVNACNQKNHRDPVVAYDEPTVQRALESLRVKGLAYTFHGSESRTVKYGHLFPKAFDLDDAGTALICVLILRGPQTPGELRARTGHLLQFDSLTRVEEVLNDLSVRAEPLVVKLPRQPNSREARFAHLLGGEVDLDLTANEDVAQRPERQSADPSRLEKLEGEVATLREEVASLRLLIEDLRRQFE
ncbi:MAG: DUF480 domain-containing protein [Acidobacteria bacterium]|nr:DUF480 domain-containing protein [Acidobacteriota bacterium]